MSLTLLILKPAQTHNIYHWIMKLTLTQILHSFSNDYKKVKIWTCCMFKMCKDLEFSAIFWLTIKTFFKGFHTPKKLISLKKTLFIYSHGHKKRNFFIWRFWNFPKLFLKLLSPSLIIRRLHEFISHHNFLLID